MAAGRRRRRAPGAAGRRRRRAARRRDLRDARAAGARTGASTRRWSTARRRGCCAAKFLSGVFEKPVRRRRARRSRVTNTPEHQAAGPGGGAQGDRPAQERQGPPAPRPDEAARPWPSSVRTRRASTWAATAWIPAAGWTCSPASRTSSARACAWSTPRARGSRSTRRASPPGTRTRWWPATRRRTGSASPRRPGSPQGADAVVLVLGGNESTSREAWADNHLGDADTLDLPGQQDELVEAVAKAGKPMVAVLLNGRPHSIVKLSATRAGDSRGLLPRTGRRHRGGGRAVRRREPERQAAHQHPALGGPAARSTTTASPRRTGRTCSPPATPCSRSATASATRPSRCRT